MQLKKKQYAVEVQYKYPKHLHWCHFKLKPLDLFFVLQFSSFRSSSNLNKEMKIFYMVFTKILYLCNNVYED